MPLYEIVLHFADRHEVRLTDRRVGVGDVMTVGSERWRVAREDSPLHELAATRYVCEPDNRASKKGR